jgi:hypothetical protein
MSRPKGRQSLGPSRDRLRFNPRREARSVQGSKPQLNVRSSRLVVPRGRFEGRRAKLGAGTRRREYRAGGGQPQRTLRGRAERSAFDPYVQFAILWSSVASGAGSQRHGWAGTRRQVPAGARPSGCGDAEAIGLEQAQRVAGAARRPRDQARGGVLLRSRGGESHPGEPETGGRSGTGQRRASANIGFRRETWSPTGRHSAIIIGVCTARAPRGPSVIGTRR